MSNNKVTTIKNNSNNKAIISKSTANDIHIKDGSKNNNKLNDNSVTKNNITNNNKIIPRNKNANKKQKVNRNILPPQEKPTVENGGFLNELETNFQSLRTKPIIDDISFIRPNLVQLYTENREVDMYAYVDEHRKKDGRFVLYNVCSESMFLSDHLIVKDKENELIDRIGTCIKFTGSVYRYDDKYSVLISNVRQCCEPAIINLDYNDINMNDDLVEAVCVKISEASPKEQLAMVEALCVKLNTYSSQIFGCKKFLLGMIFDFFFMRSRNENISNNKYMNDLDICKPISIMILSDIIYGIERGKTRNFIEIRHRILQIATLCQGITSKDVKYNPVFNNFCKVMRINKIYGEKYVADVYKRYKLKNIIITTNGRKLNYEMRISTASILLGM